MLTTRGGTRVIADLTALGYDCRWTVMGAADVGANHQRDRMWIVAYSASARRNEGNLRFQGKNGCTSSERASTVFEQSSKTPSPMADTNGMRELQQKRRQQDQWGWIGNSSAEMAYANSTHGQRNECAERTSKKHSNIDSPSWWQSEPNVGRVADGVAARVDRLKAIGNGQVPLCAATAWRILTS